MLILTYGDPYPVPCTLLLGGFDGLHLGHRALLRRAKKYSGPVGITTMIGGKGKALFTKTERELLFANAGLDFVCEIPFTEEIKRTSAEDFLSALLRAIKAEHIVCGEDFRFGRDALGTPALLKRFAPCPVEVVPIIRSDCDRAEEDGAHMRKISASGCKEHLIRGELALLNACLCAREDDFYDCAYFVQGTVEHGRQVGRTYGFPTLNLTVSAQKLLPPDGVYGGYAKTPKGNFPCIMNIGASPTFGVEERKLEAYLDGFSGDLYGESVCVYPMEFYRSIQKFSSPEALCAQLQSDIRRLRNVL